VTRYRTFEQAERALWRQPGDPSALRAAAALFAFARRLRPTTAARGVRRFRTFDEARRAREAWEQGAPVTAGPHPGA
jgi:hypothetical protein